MTPRHRLELALAAHVGRRGAILVLFGIIWAGVGYGIASGAADEAITANGALFHLLLPIPFRVGLWVGCAIVAVVAGLLSRGHTIGYVALFIPAAERCLSFMGGWVVSLVSDGGAPGAWSPGLTWLIVVLVIVIEAKTKEQWPSALERRKTPRA